MFRVLVPFCHVKNVPKSIEFFAKLGFEVGNTFLPDGAAEPTWAWLQTAGRAQLMLAKASHPVEAAQQAVLFYLYVDDVAAKHAELAAAGVRGSDINHPFYAERGEFRVVDPDGYTLMIAHT